MRLIRKPKMGTHKTSGNRIRFGQWLIVFSMLAFAFMSLPAQKAFAAGEKYSVEGGNTITGSGGIYDQDVIKKGSQSTAGNTTLSSITSVRFTLNSAKTAFTPSDTLYIQTGSQTGLISCKVSLSITNKAEEASLTYASGDNPDTSMYDSCTDIINSSLRNVSKSFTVSGLSTSTITAGTPTTQAACKLAGGTWVDGTTCAGYTLNTGTTASEDNLDTSLCAGIQPVGLRWILCPVTEMLQGAATGVENILIGLLSYDTTFLEDKNESGNVVAKQAWYSFRNIALALIVIAGLLIVINQALGLQILDAYTIKKALPRLLVAIILISISWELTKFLITTVNYLGGWTSDIILAPFKEAAAAENAGKVVELLLGSLGAGVGVVAYVAVGPGIFGVLSMLLVAVVGALIGLAVIGLRTMIISLSVLVAPLALASMVLPITEKFWEFWKKAFISALVVYPIIMAFLAIGKVMASLTNNGFMAIIFYFGPYAMLPIAFRLAGGLMSTVAGLANDRSRGFFDTQRKHRQAHADKNRGEFLAGTRFSEHGDRKSAASRLNRLGMRFGSASNGGRFGFTQKGKSYMEGMQALNASQLERTNQLYAAYKDDDKVMSVLAFNSSESEAKAKIDKLRADGKHDEAARMEQALGAARAIGFNSTTQRAALMNAATIGYGVEAGEEGWKRATGAMRQIAGISPDASEEKAAQNQTYRDLMNQYQYIAKGVGRADQSGNVDGGAYDGYRAWSSVGLYQHGNGKPKSIEASGDYFSGLWDRATLGQLNEQDIKRFGGKVEAMDAVAVFSRELATLGSSATGAARDEALKQKARIELNGGEALKLAAQKASVQVAVRGYDPEQAQRTARDA